MIIQLFFRGYYSCFLNFFLLLTKKTFRIHKLNNKQCFSIINLLLMCMIFFSLTLNAYFLSKNLKKQVLYAVFFSQKCFFLKNYTFCFPYCNKNTKDTAINALLVNKSKNIYIFENLQQLDKIFSSVRVLCCFVGANKHNAIGVAKKQFLSINFLQPRTKLLISIRDSFAHFHYFNFFVTLAATFSPSFVFYSLRSVHTATPVTNSFTSPKERPLHISKMPQSSHVATERRVEIGTDHSLKHSGKIMNKFWPQKNSEFIRRRLHIFENLYKKQQERIQDKNHSEIQIELLDGSVKEGKKFETTPYDIALKISKSLASTVIIAEVCYKDKLESEENIVCADNEEEEERIVEQENSESTDWILWDLTRPLEGSCKLKMLKFEDKKAQNVFWHSSAHVLGQSLEEEYGALLTVGPALLSGFYYDGYMGDMFINKEAYETLEKHAQKFVRENQKFERLVCSKEEALNMFEDNPFKVQLIKSKIPEGGKTTCYRCGNLVDLCKGPHLPSTGYIKAFKIIKHSSAYWLGKCENDSLQRVYGLSFPEQKQLKEHLKLIEEAKKKDHRLLGQNLNFFFFDTVVSPGSCFWLPYGARIYNKLCDFMRKEYRIRGFSEVITPNIFSSDLWKISGHYENYKDNMYLMDIEQKEWGLKPMNCPGHCVMFKHMNLSYRQLPIRMADFGVLHRNELSGTLAGLTRVRRFQQDDAHIFCRIDQLKNEVLEALNFLFFVYGKFGFKFELTLATKPKKALGSAELWNEAEAALEEALNETKMPWSISKNDGAFYGPKIDICVWDALKRSHQCGTIQIDFQLPIRFNLTYKTQHSIQDADTTPNDKNISEKRDVEEGSEYGSCAKGIAQENENDASSCDGLTSLAADVVMESNAVFKEKPLKPGYARPVIVHRAILGSVERMCAILLEHSGGRLPFWLSPKQLIVLPVNSSHNTYAQWVVDTLNNFGYYADLDHSNNTINKKVRDAQVEQWNYILVVGDVEYAKGTVTVRCRDDPTNKREIKLEDLLVDLEKLNNQNSKPFKKFVPWDPNSLKKDEAE